MGEKIKLGQENDNMQEQSIWDKLSIVNEKGTKDLEKILELDLSLDKNKKHAIESLEKMSFPETLVFLQVLEDFPNRHLLPQWFFNSLLEKFFVGWENFPEKQQGYGDADDIMTFAITAANNLNDYKGLKTKDESVLDKFFKSFVINLENHTSAGKDYWDAFKYSINEVRPDILINGLANIVDNKNIDVFTKGNILEQFGEIYSIASRRKQIDDGIDLTLNFKDHENYANTLKVIKFLDRFFKQAEYMPEHGKEEDTYFLVSEMSQYDEVSKGVKEIIQKKIDQGNGSFILNLYAKKILSEMSKWENSSESKKRLKMFEKHNQSPFNIASEIVGYFDNDKLYIGGADGGDLKLIEMSDLKMVNKVSVEKDNLFLNDFIFLNSPESREIIKKDIGIDLSLLTLPEEANFLQFLYTRTEEQVKDLKGFVDKYGINGFKSFLSLESGDLPGEEILNIGERLDSQDANKIFERYAEIVSSTENIRETILNFSKKSQIDDEDLNKTILQILKRANNLLISFSQKIKSGEKTDEAEVLKELEKYKTDALVFASIFKTAHDNGDLTFEQIKNISYASFFSSDLSDGQKESIRKLIKLNYPKQKQQENILDKVENSFQNKENSRWHLLDRQGDKQQDLVSCLRFDDIDKKNVYGATFNVGVSYRGSKIGEAMFERVMGEVAQEKRVHAIAEMGKEVSSFYVGRGGFNVVGIEQNEKTGIYYYKIERFDPENEYYASKKTSDQKLMSYYDPEKTVEELVVLQKYILVKKEDINQQRNIKDINYLLDNNYLMTKMIQQKKEDESKQVDNYLVFEKKIDMNMGKSA